MLLKRMKQNKLWKEIFAIVWFLCWWGIILILWNSLPPQDVPTVMRWSRPPETIEPYKSLIVITAYIIYMLLCTISLIPVLILRIIRQK